MEKTPQFKDLPIGQKFDFLPGKFGYSIRGPWIKVSARGYRDLSDGPIYKVGTIKVIVDPIQ